MGLATSQQLQNYYDHYRDTEITYTKDILRTLNLDPRQIYVKCNGSQWPCIINSTSFIAARIIIGAKGGAFAEITKKDVPPVNIRFCFIDADNQPLSFFVTGKVSEVKPYMSSQDLVIVTITFTQRPPDDFIEKIGALLDANVNAVRRREERIILNAEVKRKMGLYKEETIVLVQGVPRRCILRDLSFSGVKLILQGLSKFLQDKEAMIQMRFEDPSEILSLKGTVVSTGIVEGRPDIIIASIKYDEQSVPLAYKMRINNYLSNIRKNILNANNEQAHQAAAVKAAAAKALAQQKAAENAAEQVPAGEAPVTEPAS